MTTRPWGEGNLTIRLNNGRVVSRPYRKAISLVSRRLAERVDAEAPELETVPLGASSSPQTEVPQGESWDPTSGDLTETEITKTVAYEDMLLEDLRELVRARGLQVSGNKPDLIARLVADDDDMDLVGLSAEGDSSGASAEDEPHEDSASSDGDD